MKKLTDFFILFLSIVYCKGNNTICSSGQSITVFWYPQTPYIYGTTNAPVGILPLYLESGFRSCSRENISLQFEQLSSNRNDFFKYAFGQGPSPVKNDSIPIWLPISVDPYDEPKKVYQRLFTVYQLSILALKETDKLITLLSSLVRTIPFLAFTCLLTLLFGFLVWFVERFKNSKEFAGPFIRGSFDGFWWAIVTMTTVGYGDSSPKSILGRAIAVLWMTIGLIVFPLLTAQITSALTDKDTEITGKKIGVLFRSTELSSVVRLGGFATTCLSIDECLSKLRNDLVSGIAVDSFVAGVITRDNFDLKIISHHVAAIEIGITHGQENHKCLQSAIACMSRNTTLFTNSVTSVLGKSASTNMETLFNETIKQIAKWLGILIMIIFVMGISWDLITWKVKMGIRKGIGTSPSESLSDPLGLKLTSKDLYGQGPDLQEIKIDLLSAIQEERSNLQQLEQKLTYMEMRLSNRFQTEA